MPIIWHESNGRVRQSKTHSQVAVDRTSPYGLVLGIDVIPAQPPTGVSTIQGNFLSPAIQDEVKKYLSAARKGKHRHPSLGAEFSHGVLTNVERDPSTHSYLEQEKQSGVLAPRTFHDTIENGLLRGVDDVSGEDRTVDVVLSDMSAPWEQTEGFWKRSLSDPYYRMMNTSGINFRDHAGSMVCCMIQSMLGIFSNKSVCFRIYVKRPWNLRSTPFASMAISSANSTKARKIRHSKIVWKRCFPKYTETNRNHPEMCAPIFAIGGPQCWQLEGV